MTGTGFVTLLFSRVRGRSQSWSRNIHLTSPNGVCIGVNCFSYAFLLYTLFLPYMLSIWPKQWAVLKHRNTVSPPQRPLSFSGRGMGRGEKNASCGGWGKGNFTSLFPSSPALPEFSFFFFLPPPPPIFCRFPWEETSAVERAGAPHKSPEHPFKANPNHQKH